ncbi:hypothetical protein Fmac_012130 [Flemingia macrophylla]|uniref:Uncharacterized protein n=1 Tax=Flemingia macrophylla TaxID=520843 RepID=A0ABD1MPG4_9FABA
MGWEVVRQESIEKPGDRSRLWDLDDIYEVLKNEKNLVNLKQVRLYGSKFLKALPDFSKAINLELLDLRFCSQLTSVCSSVGAFNGMYTSNTMASTIEAMGMSLPYRLIQEIIRPIENPIKKTTHIHILYGNLAPEGSVAKITGKEGLYFSGEVAMIATISDDPSKFKVSLDLSLSGYCLLILQEVALLTNGRFSGGSHGFVEAPTVDLVKLSESLSGSGEANVNGVLQVGFRVLKKQRVHPSFAAHHTFDGRIFACGV